MATIIASTYELIEKIGSGGGGNVYLANHLRLGKKVVLKADKRKLDTKPELLRREVDILKNLSHSYIPQVYDFFVENENIYTVMEFIEGESLDKPLKRGETFSQSQVIKWAKQLLEALSYLHNPIHGDPPHGYVHSDIKPANIMRTPHNDICLIDFNIALALGEENVVGRSAGYSSPEHYGLDYSKISDDTMTINESETVTLIDQTETLTLSSNNSKSIVTKIVPDARSDIYSVGATLYHLLCGKRPAKDAKDVIPLSANEFNPQIVGIITKAMNPNPDMRYQTADEMLNDFCRLHENDPRVIKLKRNNKIVVSLLAVSLTMGLATSFVGLKRMQTVEKWLKLSKYSESSLNDGNSMLAIDQALEALPNHKNIFVPNYIPEAQKALTDALGVYDLSDGYKKYKTIELPSNPLYLSISPNGSTAACVYSGNVVVFDTLSIDIISTMSSDESALSEVKYINNDIIVYSGDKGITVYDISKKEIKWTGNQCTGISVSQDGKIIASVYKNDDCAYIYDAETGKEIHKVNFDGKYQKVAVNDSFINPNDNLFTLNHDGTLLGVSFADGSLEIFDLNNSNNNIEIYDESSGYNHFEGGFYNEFLAFSATNSSKSTFAVIDTVKKEQAGGFESETYYSVKTDNNGIYVQTKNILVKIHPITGEQTPLITTSNSLDTFATDGKQTITTSNNSIMFFDENSNLITEYEDDLGYDFAQLANGIAIVGSQNSPTIKIMKYENHSENNVFNYDSSYDHDEARISADKKSIMIFSYKRFRIYDINGELIKEVEIPNAKEVYDQQFIRNGNDSQLEVTYNDGTKFTYNARDGNLISEEKIDKPDPSLYEEFYTKSYRIESPLHGAPSVYDKDSNKLICELKEDAYLTYVTQLDGYILTQYITTNDKYYGVLLNEDCEVLAYLPYLTDVYDNELYFDYPTGSMRKSQIYSLDELIRIAQEGIKGGK